MFNNNKMSYIAYSETKKTKYTKLNWLCQIFAINNKQNRYLCIKMEYTPVI